MDDARDLKQLFFDEAAEQLDDLELQLSGLSTTPGDGERLNGAFRAVHSIKGAANLVGFDRIGGFAHRYESFLHKLRSKQVAVDEAVVALLLRGRDMLHDLIEHARAGNEPPHETEADLAARFDSYAAMRGDGEHTAAAKPAASPGRRLLRLRLVPQEDRLGRSAEPHLLFAELRRLGPLTVSCDLAAVPPLDRLDVDVLHFNWTMELETAAAADRVREIATRAAGQQEVEIIDCGASSVSAPAARSAAATSSAPAEAVATDESAGKASAAAGADAIMDPALPLASSIRVDVDRMDRLVNLVGELVISQSMLTEQLQKLPTAQFAELSRGIEELSRHARRLQEGVMAIRAQPVQSVFSRMPKLVRELAAQIGKRLRLETFGEDTEIDKTVIEQLYDPIIHMIRNAADHGIETPAEREAVGKPATGTIRLSAGHSGGRIVIQVADDGRGIDRDRVRARAVAAGLVDPNAALSDDEIDNLIFLPGLSTANEVSSISGRGVGMDVVRKNIQRLGGRVTIRSTPGQGSVFHLMLPLTLAVLDGMIVRVGAETYVVPLANIVESLRPNRRDVHALVGGADVLSVRGAFVPLIHLNERFGSAGGAGSATAGLVMLVDTDSGGRIGLVVDEIVGQQQVVVKSLEANYRALPGIAGATILGSGRVGLILDVSSLYQETTVPEAAAGARNSAAATQTLGEHL